MPYGGHISGREIRDRAQLPYCKEHPTAGFTGGFGLAGGGYGPYNVCDICGNVFGKVEESEDS